jgi:hypothetical protein
VAAGEGTARTRTVAELAEALGAIAVVAVTPGEAPTHPLDGAALVHPACLTEDEVGEPAAFHRHVPRGADGLGAKCDRCGRLIVPRKKKAR